MNKNEYQTVMDIISNLKTKSELADSALTDNKYTKFYLGKRNLSDEVLDYIVSTSPNIFLESTLRTQINEVILYRLHYLYSNNVPMDQVYLISNSKLKFYKYKNLLKGVREMSFEKMLLTFLLDINCNICSTHLFSNFIKLAYQEKKLRIDTELYFSLVAYEEKYAKSHIIDFGQLNFLSKHTDSIKRLIDYLGIVSQEVLEIILYSRLVTQQAQINNQQIQFILADHLEQYNLLEIMILLLLGRYKKADLNFIGTRNLIYNEIQEKISLLRDPDVYNCFKTFYLQKIYTRNENLNWFLNSYQRRVNRYPYFIHADQANVINYQSFKSDVVLENQEYFEREVKKQTYLKKYLAHKHSKLLSYLNDRLIYNTHMGILVENELQKKIVNEFLKERIKPKYWHVFNKNDQRYYSDYCLKQVNNLSKLMKQEANLSLPDQANVEYWYEKQNKQKLTFNHKITVFTLDDLRYLQAFSVNIEHLILIFTEKKNLLPEEMSVQQYRLITSLSLASKSEFLLNFSSPKTAKGQLNLFNDYSTDDELTISQPLRYIYQKLSQILSQVS